MNHSVVAITQQPNDQMFYYGQHFCLTFTLTCPYPRYSAHWYFNNRPLCPGNFEVVQEPFQCGLKGKLVAAHHQGFYYCKVATADGNFVVTRQAFVSIGLILFVNLIFLILLTNLLFCFKF